MLLDHLAELPSPRMALGDRFRVVHLFAAELTITVEPPLIQRSGCYGRLDGTARLRLVGTIVEPALLRQGLHVFERRLNAGLRIRDAELPHAGAVQQQPAGLQQVQRAMRGGVPALTVILPDAAGGLDFGSGQAVDQGGFTHPGRSEQGDGLAGEAPGTQRLQVFCRELVISARLLTILLSLLPILLL